MSDMPKYPVTTLMKALDILNYMAKDSSSTEIDISEISKELKMGKSTVHRLLDTLLYYDYVKKNPKTNQYSLGWQIYNVGQKVLSRNQIYNLDRVFLENLNNKLKETVNLAILNNNEAVILSKIDYAVTNNSLMNSPVIREATYATSLGKVLISEKTDSEIVDLFSNTQFHQLTPHTISDLDMLLDELHKVRKQGYGVDDQEFALGLYCMACPIRDYSGQIIAAVSVSSPYAKALEKKDEILSELSECCKKISKELGYTGNNLLTYK